MAQFRNVLFTALIAVALFSPLGYVAIGIIAPDLARPELSSLERRNYQTWKGIASSSPLDGSAQEAFEQYVSDYVPFRDQAMLFNAALQRQGIRTAAILRNYQVYPTYYGSKDVECPSQHLVLEVPQLAPTNSAALSQWIGVFNEAAEAYPNVEFSIRMVLETRHSEHHPAYKFTSGQKIDSEWVQRNMIDLFDSRLNAEVDSIASEREIQRAWFSTDMHWTLKRALKTYNSIADDLDLNHFTYEDPIKVIPKWQGGLSRTGLIKDYTSNMYDMPTDFSQLEYFPIENDQLSNEPGKDPGRRAKTLASKRHRMHQRDIYQGYSTYYGAFNGLIVNHGSNNGKTCLIIGDSLTHCLKRYIASNYQNTYSVLPGNFRTSRTLGEYIEYCKPDDVIVVTQCVKYLNVAQTSPAFMKSGGLPAA